MLCNNLLQWIKKKYVILLLIQSLLNSLLQKSQLRKMKIQQSQKTRHLQVMAVNRKSRQNNRPRKNYPNKDFLFTDGYTMDNVTEAAYAYLKESGKSGSCIPLKNSRRNLYWYESSIQLKKL